MSAWPSRFIERPSGTWELLAEEKPTCVLERGPVWYVFFRRAGRARWYSGPVEVDPVAAADDELVPWLARIRDWARTPACNLGN